MSTEEPGSPKWYLECARSDYNMAARRVDETRSAYEAAIHHLVTAAEKYGRAHENAKHV